MVEPQPIPGPPGLPLLGNLTDLDPVDGIGSLGRLADKYGEIYKLNLAGMDKLFISSVSLLNDMCDEKRFTKAVQGALEEVRHGVQDGLFTAYPGEHNWEVAHRTLMPAFGPLPIRGMFDEMHDIASQLVTKWARFGAEEKIDVTGDFTRLTLDSIALCAMDVRFNSFYRPEMHPFVEAMTGFLAESGNRARRPAIANYFMRGAQQKFDSDISLLKQVAAEVVAQRRKHPSDKKDLLNAMILGRDPKTKEGLTDASILNNMITFLVAGHETTSGLLSFLFYYLIKNPASYQTAQSEVDKIIGRGPITVEHMSQLPYISACLRETLRLTPTAPAWTVEPLPTNTESPTLIGGGKYEVKPGTPLIAILPKIHSDPAVYGEDAEEFKPERMLDEPFSKLPPNAWKPFGNGVRGCIGRPFAWQEALLSTAMLLQNFNFRMDDPTYNLQIKQTLTLKPKDFYIHATLRDGIDPVYLEKMLHVDTSKEDKASIKGSQLQGPSNGAKSEPMTILYGSNSGTCEALAQSLARAAGSRGFHAKVNPLDSAVSKVTKGEPVVLICSSYEGQPPDNAAHFMAWLETLKGDVELKDVKYTVYGCGNHDWVSTFHKVPKALDSLFKANGATRLADAGFGDVAAGDIFNDFDKWQDEIFWPAFGDIKSSSEDDAGFDIEIDTSSRHTTLRQDVKEAIIRSNEVLTAEGEAQKRHISLTLPTGMNYKVGDYLAVLPINNAVNIRRVLRRFGLPWDAMLTIKGGNTTLPTGHPVSAMDILGAYVELSQPATRRNVQQIASTLADETEKTKLLQLAGPDFDEEVGAKRLSPLDILEQYPTAALPLSSFLAMLPPMRIRQYSISSSPLSSPSTATITWSVLDTPSKAGGRFLGVASTYLSNLTAEDRVHVAVKQSHGAFHLPADIEKTPIIMLCAGTGLAPFRGFIQERAIQRAAGRSLAPAFLFIGCAHPTRDRLFASELDTWAKEGVVQLFYAYSKATEESKGCKYVQDRLWVERDEMRKQFDEGAKVFICGSAVVGEGVAKTVKRMYIEAAEARGVTKTEEEVEAWFEGIKSDRYASDVFV
ncbi:fatty acid hydroxylase [Venturia nashicola]|uniref:Bifunctional cytochrome P450/NADPH--P450 reductase n=1 Tax=Venturia nashicola TaxID=86259 RepID=A0A4Z1P9G4_9PEZI|nr:fatty acid hydroxylase [Venturia nashicola]TLD37427.1 fatty acid hydroxylase [Venturia nashicola]